MSLSLVHSRAASTNAFNKTAVAQQSGPTAQIKEKIVSGTQQSGSTSAPPPVTTPKTQKAPGDNFGKVEQQKAKETTAKTELQLSDSAKSERAPRNSDGGLSLRPQKGGESGIGKGWVGADHPQC